MTKNKKDPDRYFCFAKTRTGLQPCNLEIPTERFLQGFTMGNAIMEEIDKGPVDIIEDGKAVGRVSGYKIVRKTLNYIEEYFDSEDPA